MSVTGVVILAAFLVGLSMSWTSIRGAPFVPTPRRTVLRMLELAKVGKDSLVYDLGCGDGRLIVAAARRFGARAVGVEIDLLRFLWCRFLVAVLGLRDRVHVRYGNLFRQDLRDADVVVAYLLPDTNSRLQIKLAEELGPKARVVAHAFTFPALVLLEHDESADVFLYEPRITGRENG